MHCPFKKHHEQQTKHCDLSKPSLIKNQHPSFFFIFFPLHLPWHNTGWLGVRHQFTYLFPPPPPPLQHIIVGVFIHSWTVIHNIYSRQIVTLKYQTEIKQYHRNYTHKNETRHALNLSMHINCYILFIPFSDILLTCDDVCDRTRQALEADRKITLQVLVKCNWH